MAGLTFNIDPAGRLLILPTHRRCAALRLTADGVDLLYPELTPVSLPWDAYGEFRTPVDGPIHDGWVITHFLGGRGTKHCGLAVRVSGTYDIACHALFAETATARRRVAHWMQDDLRSGHRVSVVPSSGYMRSLTRTRPTLAALGTVVTRRQEFRRAFADPQRTARLATELRMGALAAPVTRTGGRRDTVDILYAMRSAGVFHRFGRPLPGDPMPTLQQVVALIHSRLSASPFWKHRLIDDDRIAKLARKHYLDVQPWPFAALL